MKIRPRTGWVRADQVADESAAQEIVRLRRQIDEMEAHIAQADSTAPPDTEELAQGDETIQVHFNFENIHNSPVESQMDFSWNRILSVLGPILIVQASEMDLKGKLCEAFANRLKDEHKVQICSPYVRDEDFQRIKLQMRALGLMQEVSGRRMPGYAPSWTLTPYGDRIMTQVAAIRSSRAKNA